MKIMMKKMAIKKKPLKIKMAVKKSSPKYKEIYIVKP